jgi:transcriptional regulator with XRE-family HTH domain
LYNSIDVGARLRDLREKRGLSQKQVSEKLGLSQSSIAQYESGKTELTSKVLVLYSELYIVSVDYLLGLTDKPMNEHKNGNTIYFTTSKKPPDLSTGEPETIVEKSFTLNSDGLPANRQELEQLVRNLLREMMPVLKKDEQK